MATTLEKAQWENEPTPELVVGFLRNYLSRANYATRHDKVPVPLLGHLIDKPNIRRNYGGYVVGALLELDGRLGQRILSLPPKDEPPIESKLNRGRAIFAKLDDFREGPEGRLSTEATDTIHNLAETKHDHPLIRLGRLALEGLGNDWRQALGLVSEAQAAIELYAISDSHETAA